MKNLHEKLFRPRSQYQDIKKKTAEEVESQGLSRKQFFNNIF